MTNLNVAPVAHDGLGPTTPTMIVEGSKAMIRLNRPRQHNRLEPEDVSTLISLLNEIEAADRIRVMVLSATGPSFSSGYDIRALSQETPSRDRVVSQFEFCHSVSLV